MFQVIRVLHRLTVTMVTDELGAGGEDDEAAFCGQCS